MVLSRNGITYRKSEVGTEKSVSLCSRIFEFGTHHGLLLLEKIRGWHS
jgi:hypothetical protein